MAPIHCDSPDLHDSSRSSSSNVLPIDLDIFLVLRGQRGIRVRIGGACELWLAKTLFLMHRILVLHSFCATLFKFKVTLSFFVASVAP